MMGTYGMMRVMMRMWRVPSAHPVFKVLGEHLDTPFPMLTGLLGVLGRRRGWILAGVMLIAVLMATQILVAAQWRSFVTATCAAVILVPALIAVIVIYCLPATIAVRSSAIIVAARERQTWDVLLSTALAWDDLLLAWVARLMRDMNPFSDALPVVYGILAGLAALFAVVTFAETDSGTVGEVLEWVVLFLVPLQYLIERVQDFVLASLIGLAASLVAPSRHVAASIALCVMLALLMLRTLFTASMIATLPAQTPSGAVIMMLTGPSSALAVTLPVMVALVGLVALPLINEIVIRLLFRWLLRHLGERNVHL